jgi:Coenzyme PQQ synthesis protein D (PqqD)
LLRPRSGSDTLGPFKAIQQLEQGASVVKLSEHVRSTHNADGAVVLDILHGEMYRLNLVGSRMLELLKDGFTNAQIADAVSRQFGVARETVAADLEEFLQHLEKHKLLNLSEPGRRPVL